jgi:type II secretory pathway pseudopilin PulG
LQHLPVVSIEVVSIEILIEECMMNGKHINIKKNLAIRSDHRLARQRGASLLEGIAYLGIAAIVVLGAVSLLTGAFGSAKANQMTEEVVAIRTAIRKLYIGQTYPTASLVPSLLTANAIPNTLARPTTTTLSNSWGGAVTIAGTATGFTVTYNTVPQDVCVSMISGASGWTQIDQGGNNAITTFPATVANANALCTVSAATGNAVTFTAS